MDYMFNNDARMVIIERDEYDNDEILFDEVIEFVWDIPELNVTNFSTYCVGNDCVQCSMLGGMSVTYLDDRSEGVESMEYVFNSRDVEQLNVDGLMLVHISEMSPELWFETND